MNNDEQMIFEKLQSCEDDSMVMKISELVSDLMDYHDGLKNTEFRHFYEVQQYLFDLEDE